jgi:hypothetical protein
MKKSMATSAVGALALTVLATFGASRAVAQDPILTPIILNEVVPMVVDEVAPIVIKTLTPKPKQTGLQKYEGTIVNANIAQVTVRAKGNDMGIQTFALNASESARMQKVVDGGGYQYGDRVTIYYDPTSHTAMKIKGKPSRPL